MTGASVETAPDDAGILPDAWLRDEVVHLALDPRFALYAVLDGARVAGLAAALDEAGLHHDALHDVEGEMAALAPRLVDPYRDRDDEARRLRAAATGDDDADAVMDGLSEEATLASRAEALAERMRAALEEGDETGGGLLSVPPPRSVPRDGAALHARVNALAAFAAPGSGAVFWVGPADLTAETLRRHLRRVARVLIPRVYLEPEAEGGPLPAAAQVDGADDQPDDATCGPALLRHQHGDVLAEVLLVLTCDQAGILCGPAAGLLFDAPSHPGPMGTTYAWPVHPFEPLPHDGGEGGAGPIRLAAAQMEEIGDLQLEGSRHRVGRYLRDMDPEAAALDPEALRARVLAYEAAGDRMGLRSERAHMKWAYGMSVTGGGLDAEETRAVLQDGEAHPDTRIDLVLEAMDDLWDGAGA